MEAEWMARATRDADECARAEAHAMVDVLEARTAELEAALSAVLAMETNRYACASERNLCFAKAREVLSRKNA